MSAARLCKLMNISEKLGHLNYERFNNWTPEFDVESAQPAVTFFAGDVYLGMEADRFTKPQFKFLNQHLRILSGLYGSLRPLDAIQPYRLEMGSRLPIGKAKNLYGYWGDRIAKSLQEQLKSIKSNVLVNLASNEYFNAVNLSAMDVEVVTPVFKDLKKDKYKVLSFFAKRARGAMVREIVMGKLTKPEQLKSVTFDGYEFREDLSNSNKFVFARDAKPE
ncbi:UNVERIFIED_CONTAM: hypothetical protein GTU68_004446 [Idotea baltica]|nr:hypothetical protein [Idotea baltica]